MGLPRMHARLLSKAMNLRTELRRTKRGLDRTVSDAERVVTRLSSSESDPVGETVSQSASSLLGRFNGEFERVKPDIGDIEGYVADYHECPLVSTPIDNWASDVLAPGIRIETSDSALESALLGFCSDAAIRSGEFDHDFADLLEEQVRDTALRGTGFAEIAYADRKTAEEIKGFQLLKAGTLTPYTRPGQAILLKGDDAPSSRSSGGKERTAPQTAAGKTAAYVQFDNVFASNQDEEEIAFAQDDVVKIVNRPETSAIFGRSDVEAVHSRVRGLLQKLEDVDTAIAAKAYAFWLIRIGSEGSTTEEDIEQAKSFMSEQEPENYGPGKKQAVPHTVNLETYSGEVPEVWESLEFDVKYILSNLPTPKYRTGWEDDINRDIAIREQEDYREEVRAMRRRLESAWKPVLERVAIQLGFGSTEEPPEFEFLIEEHRDTNPLRAEWFDAQAFRATMQGLETASPGGQVDRIIPPETILSWLGQNPERLLGEAEGIMTDGDDASEGASAGTVPGATDGDGEGVDGDTDVGAGAGAGAVSSDGMASGSPVPAALSDGGHHDHDHEHAHAHAHTHDRTGMASGSKSGSNAHSADAMSAVRSFSDALEAQALGSKDGEAGEESEESAESDGI